MRAHGDDGTVDRVQAIARIDTPEELVAFRHGGILPYVLRQLVAKDETVQKYRITPAPLLVA